MHFSLRALTDARHALIAVAAALLAACSTPVPQVTQTPTSEAIRKPDAVWGQGKRQFSLATGSPGELGLLELLAAEFARTHDATVSWYKAGSGQAMKLLQERKVDMVLAHAPAAERKAVAEGWATGRVLIGSNEFWIVGPADDPARIATAADAADAFRRIQDAGATFVSRGDNSGTHQKENQIWRAAGRTPGGPRYIVTRDFMTASMRRADSERGYFLTDSSTFVAEKQKMSNLRLLFRGGEMLINPYHTLYLAAPTPGTATARQFGAYLATPAVQAMMRDFGRSQHGEPMYNDAASTAQVAKD